MLRKFTISVFVVAAILVSVFADAQPAFARSAEVRTDRATNIEDISASLRGFVDTNDDREVYIWFEWGTSSSRLNNQTPPFFVGRTSGDNFEYMLQNLRPDTTYYFRAVAENEDGDRVYGERRNFRTDDALNYYDPNFDPYYDPNYQNFYGTGSRARVVTIAASVPNDGTTYAILNGFVDTLGENTVRWFEWGTVPSFLPNSTIHVSHGNEPGNFNQALLGLRPNTTYYFRAAAQGIGNPVYGQTIAFTTRGAPPPPVYVPPPIVTPITVPVTPQITHIPTITIPVRITPIVDAPPPPPAPIERENPNGYIFNPEDNENTGNLLEGRALFGGSFFPQSLIGWMFLLLLVTILVYVAQKAFANPSHNKNAHFTPYRDPHTGGGKGTHEI